MSAVELSVVVVSWRAGADVEEIARELPLDPALELIVVDNSGDVAGGLEDGARVRRIAPGRNLGFAGGANAGVAVARAPRVLLLNPDVRARGDAYRKLLEAFDRHPTAAGLVPRLVSPDGSPQCAWQLKPLPGPLALLAHALFWDPVRGPRREPAEGTRVEQPAAAALALRRDVLDEIGGFDAGFHPAWFEDVDLARRLAQRGHRLLYAPEAVFEHRGGASVDQLGYAGFLRAYDRNLARYLRLHHGPAWALAFRALVPVGALARVLLLPVRCPRRAASRSAAASALWQVARAAGAGWPDPEPSP